MHTLEQLRSGALTGARRLDLACGLTALPPEVYGLADTLEVLNLTGNCLAELPADLPRLHRLKVIFCSDNAFTHLPEVLGDCPHLQTVGFKANRIAHVPAAALPPALRWLILTDNAIGHLPDALGERPALQKLMLAGNRLGSLPASLAGAQRLELARLSANRLESLPGWLAELPALAWLALSGNALGWEGGTARTGDVDADTALAACPQVPWASLVVGERLGEGASGHIHRAHVASQPGQPLALKLFKGAVTSDGLPGDELAASLRAGRHPALCTPVARATGHPQGLQAVLLPLIPPGYVSLAGPPSLDSCTRDVYAPGQVLPQPVCQRLARTLAGAVAHLHAQGVMHGDLYAHNTLWHPATGDALLSDFGAATVLPAAPSACHGAHHAAHPATLGRALAALEVRAFGILLQELLDRCAPGGDTAWVAGAQALANACTQPHAHHRPSMADVWSELI